MTKFRRKLLIQMFVISDLVVFACSFFLASIPQSSNTGGFTTFFSMRIKLQNILVFVLLLYIWHLILRGFGLYKSKRLESRKREVIEIVKATLVSSSLLGLMGVLISIQMVSIEFLILFWFLLSLMLITSRLIMRQFLAWMRRQGRNLRHVVIVGTNPRGNEFACSIESRPELGYLFVGFVDDEWGGSKKFRELGRSVVCDLEHFPEFLRGSIVDEVVIALPVKSFYRQSACIAEACQEQGVIVRVLNDIFDVRRSATKSGKSDEMEVVTVASGLPDSWAPIYKRALDITIASVLLIVLAPLLLIVAVLIKLDSLGPALFVQERVGLNKRKLRIYKFRTMIVNAEEHQANLEHLNEVAGPAFKVSDDPRITKFGKILRKSSVDELPQLVNVLKGEMSLVGPRPLPLRDYQGFERDWLRRRFSVRPGITGLWQVNGRSSTSFEKWMQLDMQYIDTWSFWLDLKILAKTIPVVLKGSGAV